MHLLRNSRGMTLLEILVSLGILSLAGASLVAVLGSSMEGWSSGTSSDEATSQATLALQRLSNEIRDGRLAQISSGALVVTFPRSIADPGTGLVTYDKSTDDPNPRTYYVSGDGNLMRSYQGVTTVLFRGISAAQFVPTPTGDSVRVTLTGHQKVGKSDREHEVTGRIALRNFRS